MSSPSPSELPELGPRQRAGLTKIRRTTTFVLDATKEMFIEFEQGKRERPPTVQEIAISAGIGLPTLFQVVGKRADIISKVISRDITEALDNTAAEQGESQQKIRVMAGVCFDYFSEHPRLADAYLKGITDEPQGDFISSKFANVLLEANDNSALVELQSRAMTYSILLATQTSATVADLSIYRGQAIELAHNIATAI